MASDTALLYFRPRQSIAATKTNFAGDKTALSFCCFFLSLFLFFCFVFVVVVVVVVRFLWGWDGHTAT